jgi:hypothetical protein
VECPISWKSAAVRIGIYFKVIFSMAGVFTGHVVQKQKTSGVTSLRIAFLNHYHFPECSKGDVAISSLETETTFITSLAGTKQSQHWEIATKTLLMFFLNKKLLHPGFSRNDDAAFVHYCRGVFTVRSNVNVGRFFLHGRCLHRPVVQKQKHQV